MYAALVSTSFLVETSDLFICQTLAIVDLVDDEGKTQSIFGNFFRLSDRKLHNQSRSRTTSLSEKSDENSKRIHPNLIIV